MSARGEGLLAPGPILAIGVLLVNDHWAKAAFPGWVTGKLSDFAGLAFFPLLLQAAAEALGAPVSRRVLFVACGLTAVAFGLVKAWSPATDTAELVLGWAQWPARAAWAAVQGAPLPEPAHARIVQDPTDLVAIPAVALAGWWGWRRSGAA